MDLTDVSTADNEMTNMQGMSAPIRIILDTRCSLAHPLSFVFCWCTVDEVLDLLEQEESGPQEPQQPPQQPPRPQESQQPQETSAQRGQRLADAFLAPSCRIELQKYEKIVRRLISARVQLPRAKASMRISFKMDVAPLEATRKMCETAGLELVDGPRRVGANNFRKWKAAGPAATSRFAQLDKSHPLGFGGAKLKPPGKETRRKRCRVMTLLAPPLTVEHKISKDREEATIKAYLVTYNEEDRLGLPPHPEKIWGDAAKDTERQLKKYAKKMLGEMFVEGKPVSQTFLRNLGPQFYDSEEEASDDSDWEEGDE